MKETKKVLTGQEPSRGKGVVDAGENTVGVEERIRKLKEAEKRRKFRQKQTSHTEFDKTMVPQTKVPEETPTPEIETVPVEETIDTKDLPEDVVKLIGEEINRIKDKIELGKSPEVIAFLQEQQNLLKSNTIKYFSEKEINIKKRLGQIESSNALKKIDKETGESSKLNVQLKEFQKILRALRNARDARLASATFPEPVVDVRPINARKATARLIAMERQQAKERAKRVAEGAKKKETFWSKMWSTYIPAGAAALSLFVLKGDATQKSKNEIKNAPAKRTVAQETTSATPETQTKDETIKRIRQRLEAARVDADKLNLEASANTREKIATQLKDSQAAKEGVDLQAQYPANPEPASENSEMGGVQAPQPPQKEPPAVKQKNEGMGSVVGDQIVEPAVKSQPSEESPTVETPEPETLEPIKYVGDTQYAINQAPTGPAMWEKVGLKDDSVNPAPKIGVNEKELEPETLEPIKYVGDTQYAINQAPTGPAMWEKVGLKDDSVNPAPEVETNEQDRLRKEITEKFDKVPEPEFSEGAKRIEEEKNEQPSSRSIFSDTLSQLEGGNLSESEEALQKDLESKGLSISFRELKNPAIETLKGDDFTGKYMRLLQRFVEKDRLPKERSIFRWKHESTLACAKRWWEDILKNNNKDKFRQAFVKEFGPK